MGLEDWPDSDATTAEIFWCSASLRGKPHDRLSDYSVYWQKTDGGVRLWIGRSPHVPTSGDLTFDMRDIFDNLATVYTLDITGEIENRNYNARRKWRMFFHLTRYALIASAIALMAIIGWSGCEGTCLQCALVASLYGSVIVVVAWVSGYLGKRLGFRNGLLAASALILIVLYFGLIVGVGLSGADVPGGTGDVLALLVSAVMAYVITELRDPLRSLVQMHVEGGWKQVYVETIAAPSVRFAAVFTLLSLSEYVVSRFIDNPDSRAFLIPVGILATAAIIELVRRELSRRQSNVL